MVGFCAAKNLGGQLKAYDNEYEKMPIDLQLGVTKRFANAPFRVSATLVNLNHWDSSLRDHAVVGADILLSESLWIGAGYNFRRANEMKISTSEDEGKQSWSRFLCGWRYQPGALPSERCLRQISRQ